MPSSHDQEHSIRHTVRVSADLPWLISVETAVDRRHTQITFSDSGGGREVLGCWKHPPTDNFKVDPVDVAVAMSHLALHADERSGPAESCPPEVQCQEAGADELAEDGYPQRLVPSIYEFDGMIVGVARYEPPARSLAMLIRPEGGGVVAANGFTSVSDLETSHLCEALTAMLTGLPDDDNARVAAERVMEVREGRTIPPRLDHREIHTLVDRIRRAFELDR